MTGVAVAPLDRLNVRTATNVMQSVLFPRPEFPDALYLRSAGPGGWTTDPATGELAGAAGTLLDFDTYFNAHYLAYWRTFTSVRRIGLHLRLSGGARLSVDHRGSRDAVSLLRGQRIDGDGAAPVIVWLDGAGGLPDSGRLAISLALDTDCRISGIDYVTDAAPFRKVRLSIGICTFNRQTYLEKTLAELARLRASTPEIADVIVVNQGVPLGGEALCQAIDRAGARVIDQPNLGGAGGFCRTIVEAQAGPATHHLLMDDDIRLDARVIANTVRLLGLLDGDVALGGAMLHSHMPTRLYEAGAYLADGWIVVSNGRGIDLERADALDTFDDVAVCDYNAWWFCIIPLSAPDRAGLPLPVFLHGDDIEYGCRLGAQGIRSANFPGIGVWHETFEAKQRPWLGYYDLRNILINSAAHPDHVRPYDPLDLLGWIFHRLVLHQYETAWALIRAAEDFLAGPDDLVVPSIPAAHERVLAIPPIDRIERLADASGITAPVIPPRPFPGTVPGIAWLLARRFVQISLGVGRWRRARRALPRALDPANAGPGPWAVDDPTHPGEMILHRPDLRRLWLGALRALWVSARFSLAFKRVNRRWRNRLPALTTQAFWACQFGPDGRDAPGRRD